MSEAPIALTPKAVEMAKKKLAEHGDPDAIGFRVGVRGGGCSGYAYVFDYVAQARPGKDSVLDFDGLTIVVDHKSAEILRGSTLDWEKRLMGYGFKWLNPNAKSVCGCGDSFVT